MKRTKEDVVPESVGPVRLIEVRAQDFMRLKAVVWRPKPPVDVVHGRNEQGKTSALLAIVSALGGGRLTPPEPIRRGADRGDVLLDLDSIVVHRKWKKNDKGEDVMTLAVVAKDGTPISRPQEVLSALVGDDFMDPMAWLHAPKADQLAALERALGLTDAIGELNRRREALYVKRTNEKRDADTIGARANGLPFHEDAPPNPIDTAPLLKQLEMAAAAETEAKNRERNIAGCKQAVAEARTRHEAALARVAAVEKQLLIASAEVDRANQDVTREQRRLEETEAIPAPVTLPESVRVKLAFAQKQNEKHAANVSRMAALKDHRHAKALAAETEAAIVGIDNERTALIAAAKFPVPGVSFGADGLTVDGLPFEQASHAKRIRVAVALALARSKRLKLVVIHDADKLDSTSLAALAEVCDSYDALALLEMVRVDPGSTVGIEIEDGEVVS